MTTISAELYGTRTPPPVLLTVGDLADVVAVTVTREAPGQPTMPVRGGRRIVVGAATTILLADVDAQLGVPLVYVATAELTDGTTAAVSTGITVPDPGRHVLSSPHTGVAVLVDAVASADERTQALRASVLRPAGRRRPVVRADVREEDSGELAVYTRDQTETRAVLDLLASGDVVVSRRTAAGADLPGVEHLAVLDASRVRRTRAGDRIWTLAFVVVDPPDPDQLVSLTTLADIADFYVAGTLTTISADHPTLLDLARADLGTG